MSDTSGRSPWSDLVLDITTRPRGRDRVRYEFRAVTGDEPGPDLGFVEVVDVERLVGQYLRVLNTWADPELAEESASVRTHLDGVGLELYQSLIPQPLKDYYWRHLHGRPGLSVLLAADEGANVIPWELVKPARLGREEAPFWCESFAIARWLPSYRMADRMPMAPAACVLAAGNLRDVSAPAEHALGVAESELVETWPDLVRRLGERGLGLMHWTGHGLANRDNPSLSGLPIGGEVFRPLDLAKPENRRFASTGPWVFLHACSSAHGALSFQSLGGWPAQLIDAGCGAVLGTAWDVRASAGERFVAALYPILWQGSTLGEAVRRARIAARRDEDPSWLAYQLYANPAAHLDPEISSSQWTKTTLRETVDAVLGPRVPDPAGWLQSYLERITRRSVGGGSPVVAVEATVTGSWTGFGIGSAEVRRFADVEAALREFGAIVLLGQPGSGKSTALEALLRNLAETGLHGQAGPRDHTAVVPVFVRLEDYASAEQSPLDYVRDKCPPGLRAHLEDELLAGRVCLLCDGLDEMPPGDYFRKILKWRRFVEAYENNRFIFTCRSHNYRDELHLQQVEVRAWDDGQVLAFLDRELAADAADCWRLLRDGDLVDLARIPLLATWIIDFYTSTRGAVPKSRGALLRHATDAFLVRERERATGGAVDLDVVRSVLAEIAYQVHADPGRSGLRAEIALEIAGRMLSSAFDSSEVVPRTVLSFISSIGMLVRRADRLRFSVRQFQDYFAAQGLLERFTADEDMTGCWRLGGAAEQTADVREPGRIQAGLRTGLWDEPTVLAAGIALEPDPLLSAVLAANPLLAGRAAADVRTLVGPALIQSISDRLLTESTDSASPLWRRVEAGHVLGRLRDPRFRGVRSPRGPAFVFAEWVAVPTGTVRLGAAVDDPDAFADERPSSTVEVARFEIGRYPVTNLEYRCFIRAGGYTDPAFWTQEGWRWRKAVDTGEDGASRLLRNLEYHRDHIADLERWFREASVSAERQGLWRRMLGMDQKECLRLLDDIGLLHPRSHEEPAYAQEAAFSGGNQPVVGVNWHEATAYCRWLSEITGRTVSLPSEPQWERAAKGDVARRFPWGDRWEPGRCNCVTELVLRPSPVGVFPAGRSVFGCDDMAGNVFEWTSSQYRPYPYDEAAGHEVLATDGGIPVNRGGGWGSPPRMVRSSLRGDMSGQNAYDRDLGFRLVADTE